MKGCKKEMKGRRSSNSIAIAVFGVLLSLAESYFQRNKFFLIQELIMKYTLMLILIFSGCQQKQKTESDLEAVRNLLERGRKAHFERNAALLLEDMGEKDTFLEINRGEVTQMTKEKSWQRFTNYFTAVEFVKWDDVAEPVLQFSDDSTMAVAVVRKEVITREVQGGQLDTTHFAWTSIYRKVNGAWKLDVITSTNKSL